MSKQTLILDSSQVTTYLECPQLWSYSYVQNISLITTPPSDAMQMGTYGHRLLDIYYKARACGANMGDAIAKAVAFNPDSETCECGCKHNEHLDPASPFSLNCNKCKCDEFKAKPFPLDKAQRQLVKDRFTIHCYTYSQNDFTPLSADHVEVGFSHKLYEDDEKLYILEGRIDGIGTFSSQPAIIDHKFQMRRRDLYKKMIQFRNYSLVIDYSLLVVNYIRLTKSIEKDTLHRDISSFSKLEREWWRGELIKVFDTILAGRNNLTRNWEACSGKFGYPCQYTQLCEEINPAVRETLKSNLFHPKEVWKPW